MANKGSYMAQLTRIVGPTGHEFLLGVLHTHPTGSNYTVDPPVTNTDVDVLVLLHPHTFGKPQADILPGWQDCVCDDECGKSYQDDAGYGSYWYAVRRGVYNLIVTYNEDWYLRAIAATELCKVMNYTNKDDRVAVFSTIRDGEDVRLGLYGEGSDDVV